MKKNEKEQISNDIIKFTQSEKVRGYREVWIKLVSYGET